MSDELPAEVQGWIGEERYVEKTEFPIERGYVYTSCSSVENGNPLYWDEQVAQALTGGPIAPPSMISVWFRPHHWAPDREKRVLPLQVHFDLKEVFELPEAAMTDNTITFGVPVRRVYAKAFALGAMLAAVAGVLVVPIQQAHYLMGLDPLLLSFIVVIIGGLGSLKGTMVAAFLVGISDGVVSVFFSPTLAKIIATLLVAAVLVLRPGGLFGEEGS